MQQGRIRPGQNMLDPTYYLSPALGDDLAEKLRERCAAHLHWFSPPYDLPA